MKRCKHEHIKELYMKNAKSSPYAQCLDCGKTVGNINWMKKEASPNINNANLEVKE